jgi:hypothetical protein
MPDENPTPNAQIRRWDMLEREALHLGPTRAAVRLSGRSRIWASGSNNFDPEGVVRPLRNAGLIHKTSDGFVFATQAAFRMVQMAGHASTPIKTVR